MELSMEEMLHKYCPNGNVDPSIPIKYARKLIPLLVSYVYFSDGPVKWKEALDYIRDPNNSSNGRPRPKQEELMAMLKRLVKEYRAKKGEPDSSDVVDLRQSEEIVNASPDPTTSEIDATAKDDDDDDAEMFFVTFKDHISNLRDKFKKMRWSKNKVMFDEQHDAYLDWISRFIEKLDLSDEEDPNMLLAIRWIEFVMIVYFQTNNMNRGFVENMESFVEHDKFEWTSIETNRFGEPSSSIAKMYVNVQKPNPLGQYAVISQNSNSSKGDAIGQQQPSNLANVFPIESVSTLQCYNEGDDTVPDEVRQPKDAGSLTQIPDDVMMAENPESIKKIFSDKKYQNEIDLMNKFSCEEDVVYDVDPRLGLYQFSRTDQLNSSNFPE